MGLTYPDAGVLRIFFFDHETGEFVREFERSCKGLLPDASGLGGLFKGSSFQDVLRQQFFLQGDLRLQDILSLQDVFQKALNFDSATFCENAGNFSKNCFEIGITYKIEFRLGFAVGIVRKKAYHY